jgi:hypothetical protein
MAGNWLARIRSKGSAPQGFQDMVLQPRAQIAPHNYQEEQNYIWGNGRSNELRSALTNFWVGNYNALPSSVSFIPGVPKSRFYWNVPTAYANALQKQQQYNKGFNTSGMSALQNADLLQQVQAAWLARGGG